mgnify:CR=1 FL=1
MTEEIIQKKQYWVEFISFSKKHCNYTDEDLAEHIVKMVEKAINYTHSCTELKAVDIESVADMVDPFWRDGSEDMKT